MSSWKGISVLCLIFIFGQCFASFCDFADTQEKQNHLADCMVKHAPSEVMAMLVNCVEEAFGRDLGIYGFLEVSCQLDDNHPDNLNIRNSLKECGKRNENIFDNPDVHRGMERADDCYQELYPILVDLSDSSEEE